MAGLWNSMDEYQSAADKWEQDMKDMNWQMFLAHSGVCPIRNVPGREDATFLQGPDGMHREYKKAEKRADRANTRLEELDERAAGAVDILFKLLSERFRRYQQGIDERDDRLTRENHIGNIYQDGYNRVEARRLADAVGRDLEERFRQLEMERAKYHEELARLNETDAQTEAC